MTHKDIYTKFMIEYDKANVTSSYPSLTEYEVATVLDKAYHALIAQKVTGNNVRRVALEGDLKAISDIQGLIVNNNISLTNVEEGLNVKSGRMPLDYLYFVSGSIKTDNKHFEDNYAKSVNDTAIDNLTPRKAIVKLVNHQIAENFISSASNLPWVKNPIAYIENEDIYVVVDPMRSYDDNLNMSYIKVPNKFAKDIQDTYKLMNGNLNAATQIKKVSYFDYELLDPIDDPEYMSEESSQANILLKDKYTFECNDTMAEELISLAVAFALENVESQRLNSKLNMRGLEA